MPDHKHITPDGSCRLRTTLTSNDFGLVMGKMKLLSESIWTTSLSLLELILDSRSGIGFGFGIGIESSIGIDLEIRIGIES